MRISHQFSTLNPALQREIIRRSASKNVVSPRRAKITRNFSTSALLPKQYSFHIGTSWAGKVDRDGYNRFKIPFSAHSTIGSWRDQMLSRPKAVKSVDAGEDFFFVQEVRWAGTRCRRAICTRRCPMNIDLSYFPIDAKRLSMYPRFDGPVLSS